jgi:riboflavin kinase/FMN adenylyltransferase
MTPRPAGGAARAGARLGARGRDATGSKRNCASAVRRERGRGATRGPGSRREYTGTPPAPPGAGAASARHTLGGMGPRRTVVTVGVYDGVHAGHRAILSRARRLARDASADVLALAFDAHPLSTLSPGREPTRLTSWDDRAALLLGAGADRVQRLDPTPALLALSPGEFLDRLVSDAAPSTIVEGPDFRFGHARAGDVDVLRALARERGIGVEIVDPVEVALEDTSVVRASSTLARWLISRGRARDAARVLARPYEIIGTVEPGHSRGRDLGFPTANVRSECLVPGDGVYAGAGVVEPVPGAATGGPGPGAAFLAAISVGTRPTFAGEERALEAHLMRPGEPGGAWLSELAGYGWRLRLRFTGWLRDQVGFDSAERLVEQMARDCARVHHDADRAHPPLAAAGLGS